MRARAAVAAWLAALAATAGCGATGSSGPTPTAAARHAARAAHHATHRPAKRHLPEPAHVVIAVMENHAAAEIIGNPAAPYINHLARTGASFTNSFAITHPSEPNYLALFSGSTHGVTADSCPLSFRAPNLAAQLRAAGRSFTGYSDGLPSSGYAGCSAGEYARKHVPWTDFRGLPAAVNQPATAFPHHYRRLPALSFVIPNLLHDMHDGTVTQGDTWLREHVGRYVRWARSHNSLFVLTWDEDDTGHDNRIPTIIAGAGVRIGDYAEHVTHYRVLRTLEALERLHPIAAARQAVPITNIWRH